jgi:tetratricopeptide (TPR) repeat protein
MTSASSTLRFVAILALSAGCASVPKGPTPAEIAAAKASAEANVADGCYDCLLFARDTYARLAVGKLRPTLVQPLFETDLLLALREKELAMDWSTSLARAQALAPELPPTIDAARYLAMVEAVPGDAMGLPAAEESAFRRAHASFVPRINDEMAWLATGTLHPLVREYLSLSIDCKYTGRPREGGRPRLLGDTREVPPGTAPLIAYRLATCDGLNRAALEDVRKRVPGFVETSLFIARLDVASAQRNGGGQARVLLAEAFGRFPQSSSTTYLNGTFQQLIGVCKDALTYYDDTIALRPLHENALLGRTICLTFTNRFDEAIASATHMIDLRLSNMYEAYYWRAWIYHHQQDLPSARRDIDSAKHIASTGNIHRLAGEIEFDQDDLDQSEKDFNDAKMSSDGGSDCVSRWYLGLIGNKRSRSTDAAANFEDAMVCYARAADYNEASLRQMEARTDVDPEFRARQVEGLAAAIKEDRSQQYASACNAANHHARLGNRDKARALLDVAAKDPALEKAVAELRKIIGGVF